MCKASAMGYSTTREPQKTHARWLTEPAALCFSQSIWKRSAPFRYTCRSRSCSMSVIRLSRPSLTSTDQVLHHKFEFLFQRFAILAIHERVQDLLQQIHPAPIADSWEIGVPDAIENREAMPHEWNVFVARDVFPVGIADEQIHRFLFDPLVHQKHVRPWSFANLHLGNRVAQYSAHALFKTCRWSAGNDVHRFHIQAHQEIAERDELVGISKQRHPLAVDVLMHVGDHVEQSSAFVRDDIRNLYSGHDAHRLNEAIRRLQADRQLKHLVGYFALFFQRAGGARRG